MRFGLLFRRSLCRYLHMEFGSEHVNITCAFLIFWKWLVHGFVELARHICDEKKQQFFFFVYLYVILL